MRAVMTGYIALSSRWARSQEQNTQQRSAIDDPKHAVSIQGTRGTHARHLECSVAIRARPFTSNANPPFDCVNHTIEIVLEP